jgi:hypothetical protein
MNDTPATLKDVASQNLLDALDGTRDALTWLDEHRPGLALFVRAVDGGPRARARLQDLPATQWDQLFDAVCNEELSQELLVRRQEVWLLFDAVRGNDASLAQLRRQKPSLVRLANLIREGNEKIVAEGNCPPADGTTIPASAAADVGCLIGEMHLARGEYDKAVEAFTRAIENGPTADVFQGRARAFRALAARDEGRARNLREA